jgi:3'-5' exoribonuclease
MKNLYIRDLQKGRRIETSFLVRQKSRKISRNGSAYLDLELQDSTGVIPAKVWDADRIEAGFEADDVIQVSGSVEEYQGALQLSLNKIIPFAESQVDPLDYLRRTSADIEAMFAWLLERVRKAPQGSIRKLLLAVLEDPAIAANYKLAPAATDFHHAYLGGLLEHVVSLIKLADKVCDHYPELHRELILAGLVLHDLGKLEELQYARGLRYSTRGQLLGHIAIGLERVHEKIRAIPDFPPLLADRIEHIILSHHGHLEFGSPKLPLFPEALVVHYLDDMDSKLASIRAQYETDKIRPGDWTSRNRALGRELLKPEDQPASAAAPKTHGGRNP